MAAVLYARIRSDLEQGEFDRRLLERRPRFQDVPGLIQKIYGRDPETNDVCGVYFFDSLQSLTQFKESELARSIPQAYEAVNVRREVYEVLSELRSDVGPFAAGA